MKITFKKKKGILKRLINKVGIKTKEEHFLFEMMENKFIWDGEKYMVVSKAEYDPLEIMDKNTHMIVSTNGYKAIKEDICYLNKLELIENIVNRTADFVLVKNSNGKNGVSALSLVHKPSGETVFSASNKGKLFETDLNKLFNKAFESYFAQVVYTINHKPKKL